MPQQTSPFLEGKYGWSFGEDGWNTGMDENLLKFSFMFDRNVDTITASLPAVVNGQAHYLTTDNRIYFAVGGIYFSSPVPKWFTIFVRSTGQTHQFNGTSLVQVDSAAQLDSRLDAVELTLSTLGTAAFEDVSFFATQAALDIVEADLSAYTDNLRADLADQATPSLGAALIGVDGNTLLNQIRDRISRPVDTIAALKALDKTKYTRAFVLGYTTVGDGGGGEYWYDSSDVVSTDDGGTIIVAADGGRWKLIHKGVVSVRQFGATGDGVTDDAPAIQKAFDKALSIGLSLFMPAGTYAVATTLTYNTTGLGFTKGLILEGAGWYNTIILNKVVAGGASIALTSGASVNDFMMGGSISNIGFTESGSGSNSHGITYRGCWHQKFSALRFQTLNGSGLKAVNTASDADSSAHVAIDMLRAIDCQGPGFDSDSGSGGISHHTLENSFFQNCGKAVTGMAYVIIDGAVHFHMRLNTISGAGGSAPNIPGIWIKNTVLGSRVVTINGGEIGNNIGDHIVVNSILTLKVSGLRHVRRTGETNSTRGYVFPDGALACRNVQIEGIELQIDTATPVWTLATIGSSVGPNFSIRKINNTAFASGNIYHTITSSTFGGVLEDIDGVEIQVPRVKRVRTSYGTPGNITIDLRVANWHQINLTAAGAYALQTPTTNLVDGYELYLTVINSVGATLTFPAGITQQGYTDSATVKNATFAYDSTSATFRQMGAWSTAT